MGFVLFSEIDKSEELQQLFKEEYGCDWETCEVEPGIELKGGTDENDE